MLRRILLGLVVLTVIALGAIYVMGTGVLGTHWGPGEIEGAALPTGEIASRARVQREAARSVGVAAPKQILFGDLHVHTTYSMDAFMMALPSAGGEGAHPVSEACDFARYCSALDFWSINDHAVAITSEVWANTVEEIRQCNDVAGDPANPDVTAFLGWEWTQIGTNPENHYGHKNVIVRGLADDEVPTRPIAARPPADAFDRQRSALPGTFTMGLLGVVRPGRDSLDLIHYFQRMVGEPDCPDGVPVRDLPVDCKESALTPKDLFGKLDDWGFDSLVIPHGTTWGYYTPQGSRWDKQLRDGQHDPKRQKLIEVFSGHGNSEEFRDWHEVEIAADGTRSCPQARDDFLPSCWRAGELIAARCREAGEDEAECEKRAADARQHYVDADVRGHLTVPGAEPDEWLDSNQCRDCFQPSFNYRPRSSVQYIMALRNHDDRGASDRFDFGFLASSDNHSARPGTGYKEVARTEMTEARLPLAGAAVLPVTVQEPEPVSRPFDPAAFDGSFFSLLEGERASSFFLTGGLVAVHAEGRGRDAVWDALDRREVYGTSGPRMLLWFDLLNAAGSRAERVSMGGKAQISQSPIFQVRAVGSFEQKPGCPDVATRGLSTESIARLCRNECYHPSDTRRLVTRIEIVRIRPQVRGGEAVEPLIEDPWQVFDCEPDPEGCVVTFADANFSAAGRDALYYARAVEEKSLAVNADLLRCERDAKGRCTSVDACRSNDANDDCLAETEERAWSSPIFVEWAGTPGT